MTSCNYVISYSRTKLSRGDLAQMVERSLSMREALGSMPRFSTIFAQNAQGGTELVEKSVQSRNRTGVTTATTWRPNR